MSALTILRFGWAGYVVTNGPVSTTWLPPSEAAIAVGWLSGGKGP